MGKYKKINLNSIIRPKCFMMCVIVLLPLGIVIAQTNSIALGAYYFDGWYPDSKHITKSLTDSFSEREPKWGWITRTQPIMDEQISLAADAGLSFFSFCWYYTKNKPIDSSNKILAYYLNSPNRSQIQYCLLVTNHGGHEIGPDVWPDLVKEWVMQFKTSSYLKVNGKPLLIFFSVGSLVRQFGSIEAVQKALDYLKQAAIQENLAGVSIAACIDPNKKQIQQVEACGVDILTGYSYHSAGINVKNGGQQQVPIDSMITVDKRLWDKFPSLSSLPYIPVSTLNYDPRPWANSKNGFSAKPYFVGFSSNSVYQSVKSTRTWILQHRQQTSMEKIGLLYAWNEYGEGAWLTPSKKDHQNLLKGVKDALSIR